MDDHEFRMFGAGCSDLFQIFCMRVAFLLLLGDGDGNVSGVFNNVAERFQARFEASDPDRRRSHIDATARLA